MMGTTRVPNNLIWQFLDDDDDEDGFETYVDSLQDFINPLSLEDYKDGNTVKKIEGSILMILKREEADDPEDEDGTNWAEDAIDDFIWGSRDFDKERPLPWFHASRPYLRDSGEDFINPLSLEDYKDGNTVKKIERSTQTEDPEDNEDGTNRAEKIESSTQTEDPEDNEDGTNRAEENSCKMPQFRNNFYCRASCISRTVSFILDEMRLPLCGPKLHKVVQNDLSVFNMSIDPTENVEVGKCTLALEEFYNVGLIEEKPLLLVKIKDAQERDRCLEKAIAIMKLESHPALFILDYKENQYGTNRAGHCLAIMPNGELMDVEKERPWKPERDGLWGRVKKIGVWKIEKEVAEELGKECGLELCKREAQYPTRAIKRNTR